MAAGASRALQKGIYQTLAGNPQVTDLLGGPNLFDDPPQNAPFPYLTYGQTREYDCSTGETDGSRHTVTLHVWSRAGGKTEAQEIIDTVRAALSETPVTVDNRHRVSLRHEYSEARHDEDAETYHGIVRYRAVMEAFG